MRGLIFIKVKPKASKASVEKISDNIFKVAIKEAPERGKANLALIRILSDYFKIPQSNLKIIRGATSQKKIIELKD